MAKCGAKTLAGKPCGMAALERPGPRRCWQHAPDKADERAKAKRLGGQQRMRQVDRPLPVGPPPELKTKHDVADAMRKLIERLQAGQLDTRSGNLELLALKALLDSGTLPDATFGPGNVKLIIRRQWRDPALPDDPPRPEVQDGGYGPPALAVVKR